MSIHLAVVENMTDWKPWFPNVAVVTVKDYLDQQEYFTLKNAKIINLCRHYNYLSLGYYCSLLAEARHHKVIPSVRTLRDLSSKAIYGLDIDCLDELLQKSLDKNSESENTDTIEVYILFGHCDRPALKKLAQQIFATFSCPLLRVEFCRQGKWQISFIKPAYLNSLPDHQKNLFIEALSAYLRKSWSIPKIKQNFRYDLAILHNPEEKFSPSDQETLDKFVKIGKELDVDVDLIRKKDYSRLAEYDALFIRETTRIDHYTYRFAKKADSEGMVVIDDPDSILRCTNKVYLAELLKAKKIPRPKTLILQKSNLNLLEREIPYPVVLKIPDGSFSLGVFKVNNRREMIEITTKLFKDSDLILAQEYIYTEFDWRIGILNRKPLFACQYFMSKEHWQIVKHDVTTGGHVDGGYRAVSVEATPKNVVKAALDAAWQIGDGLYGVDVKHTAKGAFVIEVNDNPNIEETVENGVLKDEIYRLILKEFIRRIEEKSVGK